MIWTWILLFTTTVTFAGETAEHGPARNLASIRESVRIDHARELLGKYYRRSGLLHHENNLDLEQKVGDIVGKRLPKGYRIRWSEKVTRTILDEALKYQLDPLFVVAVIQGESSFNPLAKGPVGEIGLMQLRPSTAKWIAGRLKQKWHGSNILNNPVENIKLGTAYLAYLRERFAGHGQLYVAAYNMGLTNVKRALKKHIWPKDYPKHVMKRYLAFYREEQQTKI